MSILARSVGTDGLAAGQYQDLRCGSRNQPDRVADANHLKTGMLFMAAIDMAAAIAEVEDDRLEHMRVRATHLGQAFQLFDDLIDGIEPTHDAASVAEDAGKTTLLTILGRDAARQRLAQHVAHATDGLNPGGKLARFVESIFAGHLSAPALETTQS